MILDEDLAAIDRQLAPYWTGLDGARMDRIDVVDLDGEIRHRRAVAAFAGEAHLRHGRDFIGGKGDDPAVVHDDFEAEQSFVEGRGCLRGGRGDVGNDASDGHLGSSVRFRN